MAKFSEPPDIEQLRQIPPSTSILPAGTLVTRIFFADGDYPTAWDSFRHYGPTASRFDHHLPDSNGNPCEQERGIMYVAAGPESIPSCLAEVYQQTRVIDRHSREPIICGFSLATPLTLLDLRGAFSTALGASAAIHSGPRPRARRWSRQLYLAFEHIDGILYCSSMYAHEPIIALFERSHRAIPGRPILHRELKDPAIAHIVTETGRKIRYEVV